ncbi:MAG: yniI [Deltaproteobacteria bacterium]|nr:yniI [Deltaproteobacteria bacterium]
MSVVSERAGAITFACGQCGAGLAFERVRTETCPYCASPNFVERPPAANQPDPMFAVTFTGDAAVAKRNLDRWLGSRSLLADSAIEHATIEDLRGVYLPAYLYSAVARTEYTAQIGEHYTETETYETKDKDGNKQTKTRTVTRSEYRPLAGRHVGYVTDVIVSASAGISNAELTRIEPFELCWLRRFSPALISGWITEEFSRPADECRRSSRSDAIEEIGMRLRKFMPGNSFSDLVWRSAIEWESLDPILVPIWVFAVRYRADKPALRVVINGQTGKVSGKAPLSWWKVTLAIVLAIAVIAAVILLVRAGQPPPPPPPPSLPHLT